AVSSWPVDGVAAKEPWCAKSWFMSFCTCVFRSPSLRLLHFYGIMSYLCLPEVHAKLIQRRYWYEEEDGDEEAPASSGDVAESQERGLRRDCGGRFGRTSLLSDGEVSRLLRFSNLRDCLRCLLRTGMLEARRCCQLPDLGR